VLTQPYEVIFIDHFVRIRVFVVHGTGRERGAKDRSGRRRREDRQKRAGRVDGGDRRERGGKVQEVIFDDLPFDP
jgi:hypothetical protein